jgi:hypothetical protein
MRKILLTLLAIVLVLGVIGAAGFTGYRFGYARGVQAASSGETPSIRPFDRMGPDRMPMDRFGMERGFGRGFGRHGFPMMGFGGFPLFRFLTQIAVLALIVWFGYWLFTRSGWRLTRETAQPTQTVQTTSITESAPPTENE